jgi:hypothetical protein
MFCTHGYIIIIITILRSTQMYCLYVNPLIGTHKQKGYKSKWNTPKVHSLRFPYVYMPSLSFIGSLVF